MHERGKSCCLCSKMSHYFKVVHIANFFFLILVSVLCSEVFYFNKHFGF